MSLEQIIVQVNPDSLPSGSDLTAVNAARKSFGKRSDWDIVTINDVKYDYETNRMVGDVTQELKLKPKDKRLIEFLARGVTSSDYESLVSRVSLGFSAVEFEELKELIWKWRNTPTHDTPFNHSFVSFEVKAPIFVARQLVKTEYTIMSEYSRRYITDDVEFYQHDYREASEDKKQGSGGVHKDNAHWQNQAQIANERQLEL